MITYLSYLSSSLNIYLCKLNNEEKTKQHLPYTQRRLPSIEAYLVGSIALSPLADSPPSRFKTHTYIYNLLTDEGDLLGGIFKNQDLPPKKREKKKKEKRHKRKRIPRLSPPSHRLVGHLRVGRSVKSGDLEHFRV